ncbi:MULTISPECIES: DUF3563 family protein [Cupriavidus]
MFTSVLERFLDWFDRTEAERHHGYLSSSGDLHELERRMRALEHND